MEPRTHRSYLNIAAVANAGHREDLVVDVSAVESGRVENEAVSLDSKRI